MEKFFLLVSYFKNEKKKIGNKNRGWACVLCYDERQFDFII
jgi:hypothetical protein